MPLVLFPRVRRFHGGCRQRDNEKDQSDESNERSKKGVRSGVVEPFVLPPEIEQDSSES
jgi:hypothetical protein